MTNDDERYRQAKERVGKMRGFYISLTAYCLVIPMLFLINILASPQHIWFFWPMAGWGIGLMFHGLSVFGTWRVFSHEWEERKVKELLDREDRARNAG